MKKIFKLVFILLIVIILIIVVPIVILFITISDSTDNAPHELYSETITLDNQVDAVMTKFTDNHNNNFYLTFDEDNLNLLIFAIIKENINPDYYSSDNTKSIDSYTVPDNIFFFGGKKALIKHAYVVIGENELLFYLTMDGFGMETNLNLGFSFESEDGIYTLTLTKFGLGGLNLMSGVGKRFLKPVMSMIGFTEEKINKDIKAKDIPLDFEIDDFSFSFMKEDLGEIIKSQLGDDSQDLSVLTELVSILSSPENEILDIGFFKINNKTEFGVKLNLNAIKNGEELSNGLNADIADAELGFNIDDFIQNKTQTFLISNLTGSGQKIRFSNLDFNRIIYDNTKGYEGFVFPADLDAGDTAIFKVKGILFEFKTTTLDILFVVEVNGVESLITLTGDITISGDGLEVYIKLRDKMFLSNIEVGATFLTDILGEAITEFGGMTYDKLTTTFTIRAATFEEFMGVGGGVNPLTIEKFKVVEGGLDVYVEISGLGFGALIDSLTNELENVLGSGLLDTSTLDNNDPAVSGLNDTLDEIADLLGGGYPLTEELADQLLDNISGLSSENKAALLEEFNGSLPANLIDLYDDLFGL